MYLKCLFNRISEIPNFDVNLLTDTQKDLDSENYFEKNKEYRVVGIISGKFFKIMYVIKDNEITAIRPEYFDFNWQKIPKNWQIRENRKTGNIEIFHPKIMAVEDWFEKYVEDDESAIKIANSIILE